MSAELRVYKCRHAELVSVSHHLLKICLCKNHEPLKQVQGDKSKNYMVSYSEIWNIASFFREALVSLYSFLFFLEVLKKYE